MRDAHSVPDDRGWLVSHLTSSLVDILTDAAVHTAKIEIECSPQEARAFLGLPDVTALNKALTEEMQARQLQAMQAQAMQAQAMQQAAALRQDLLEGRAVDAGRVDGARRGAWVIKASSYGA